MSERIMLQKSGDSAVQLWGATSKCRQISSVVRLSDARGGEANLLQHGEAPSSCRAVEQERAGWDRGHYASTARLQLFGLRLWVQLNKRSGTVFNLSWWYCGQHLTREEGAPQQEMGAVVIPAVCETLSRDEASRGASTDMSQSSKLLLELEHLRQRASSLV